MSFLSSLTKGNSFLGIGSLKISFPTLSVSNYSIASVNGIGGFIQSAGSAVQTLTRGARTIFCLGAVLTDPSLFTSMIGQVWDYLKAHGMTLINDIWKTIMSRINFLLAHYYGIISAAFNSVLNAVRTIKKAYDALVDYFSNLSVKGKDLWADLIKKENCDFEIANMLKCLINPYILKFTRNIKVKASTMVAGVESNIRGVTDDWTSQISALTA